MATHRRPCTPITARGLLAAAVLVLGLCDAALAQSSTRVTILADAFGQRADLQKDWGFAAFIEHDGLRILFDTGNNSEWLRRNAEALEIDLSRLDFAVISHRHGDHTDGLRYLLRINPQVRIYTPNDEYFGGPTPQVFFSRSVETLPEHMRYFDGKVPASIPHGSPWKEANIQRAETVLQIRPGISVVNNISRGPGFTETPELSLVIDTPTGRVLIVGCSHPGLEQILESIDSRRRPLRLLIGGLHWLISPAPEIDRLVTAIKDQVMSIAPGHCTGEVGFAALRQAFASRYVYAGLGTVIDLK